MSEQQKILKMETNITLDKLKAEANTHHTLYELRDAVTDAVSVLQKLNDRLSIVEQAQQDEASQKLNDRLSVVEQALQDEASRRFDKVLLN